MSALIAASLARLIKRIAPEGMAVYVQPVRDLTAQLFPDEALAVARSVYMRRIEFSTGRYCARRALSLLGYSPGPISLGLMGMPEWPTGVSASISHSSGICAAVATHRRAAGALGIDIEHLAALPAGHLCQIARPDEIARNKGKVPDPWLPVCLFSIREAVFKAYYPATRVFLDFSDVGVDIDFDLDQRQGRFLATLNNRLHPPLQGARTISGRFGMAENFVVSLASTHESGRDQKASLEPNT